MGSKKKQSPWMRVPATPVDTMLQTWQSPEIGPADPYATPAMKEVADSYRGYAAPSQQPEAVDSSIPSATPDQMAMIDEGMKAIHEQNLRAQALEAARMQGTGRTATQLGWNMNRPMPKPDLTGYKKYK